MAIKICLDAGHYGKYNRSPANQAYYESEVMWKLHLLLEKYLKQLGLEVIKSRDNLANDRTLYDRGAASKDCALFLSMHSNAAGNVVNDSVDYPVAYAAISGNADEIAALLAECVEKTMETKQPARITHQKGSSGADYYGVIRGATAVGTPGLILEHSFHTNTRITNWLLEDDNLDKLARAEAAVIGEYFGAATNNPGQFLVRVSIDNLNIRTGPGTNYSTTGKKTGRGTFTIVEVQQGEGSDAGWGRLKSGAGWISLDYAKLFQRY